MEEEENAGSATACKPSPKKRTKKTQQTNLPPSKGRTITTKFRDESGGGGGQGGGSQAGGIKPKEIPWVGGGEATSLK